MTCKNNQLRKARCICVSDQTRGESPFEAIRREDENENEYWSARDLAKVLGYGEFRFFKNAIQKAKVACEKSGYIVTDHIVQTHDMVKIGSGAKPLTGFMLPRPIW